MGAQFQVGAGATSGMSARQAVYLQGRNSNPRLGVLRRSVPLAAWRGQRLRVTLRLKNDGEAQAFAGLQIANVNETGRRGYVQKNEPGGAWQSHQFVLDVPDKAKDLTINVGLTGKGTVWVDDLRLDAVDKDVPVIASAGLSGWWLSTDRS